MTKNICIIDPVLPVRTNAVTKAANLMLKLWSGAEPGASSASAEPRATRHPGPVLHRLPDLRKFGPNIV